MRIFLSAVSGQFKACRDALASDLRAVGAEVVVQEDFQQSGRTLLEKLEKCIASCDRVIALVGDAYGGEPDEAARCSSWPRRSYSQWEYAFAQGERLDGSSQPARDIYAYFASPDFLAQHPVAQYSDAAARQQAFVSEIHRSGKDYGRRPFGSLDELRAEVLRDGFRLAEPAARISAGRLNGGAAHLFGREGELAALERAWADPATHVLTLSARAGEGKTALLMSWMARQSASNWAGCERVFDWCFESQNGQEESPADAFIAAALDFFGDPALSRTAASGRDKAARLAQLVAARRALLVLDGVEWLQSAPGPGLGRLKDPAIAHLLSLLCHCNQGLCIVSAREPLVDLLPFRETTVREWQLKRLSGPAGVEFLEGLGVHGPVAELGHLVEEVEGHALTINLLGRYLAKAHQGDVRRRQLVRLEKADAVLEGGRAFGIVAAYDRWLSAAGENGTRALAVLRLLGVLNRPDEAGCLDALRLTPAIAGLTEPLAGLSDEDWNLTISFLRDCGLVSVKSPTAPPAGAPSGISAHPLVREYFARQVRESSPDAWRSAHLRLYEHLGKTTEYRPSTIPGLEPLYHAVVHGCHAGRVEEALLKTYADRIQRGSEYFSVRKLGAAGADLAALAAAFEQPWSRPAAALSDELKAWVLNEAGTRLQTLGRLVEALVPIRAACEVNVGAGKLTAAAACATNLSDVELLLGEIQGAARNAEQAIEFATRAGSVLWQIGARTMLADVRYHSGRSDEALRLFHEAESLQAQFDPSHPLLYSLRGFRHCDALLAEPERAAWQVQLGATLGGNERVACLVRCREIEKRATVTMTWAKAVARASVLAVGLDQLTLGRAAMYMAALRSETSSPREQTSLFQGSADWLTNALDNLRASGNLDRLPGALLSRAWCRFLEGNPDGARADLEGARELAEGSPMPLQLADVHLHRARLFADRRSLREARTIVTRHGYHRRDPELIDAEAAARSWPS